MRISLFDDIYKTSIAMEGREISKWGAWKAIKGLSLWSGSDEEVKWHEQDNQAKQDDAGLYTLEGR